MSMVGPRPALEYEVEAYKRLAPPPPRGHARRLRPLAGRRALPRRLRRDGLPGRHLRLQPEPAHRRQSLPAHRPRHAHRPRGGVSARATAKGPLACPLILRSASPSSATATGAPTCCATTWSCRSAWVSWVCDTRPEALEKAATRYPAVADDHRPRRWCWPTRTWTRSSSPRRSARTTRIAKAALEAGKHVFVEKPMTADTAQALRAGRRWPTDEGLTLMVGHTFVFSPPVRKVKEIIDARRAGRHLLRHHPAREPRPAPEGRQRGLGPRPARPQHPLLLAGRGGRAASAPPAAAASCPSIPDVAFINLRFPSGVVAEIQVSWLSPVKLRRTIVVGSQKMLIYDDTENVEKVKIFDHGVDFEEPEDFGEFQLSYRTGDIVSPKIEGAEPLFLEAGHFVALRARPASGRSPTAGPACAWSPRSRPRRRRWTPAASAPSCPSAARRDAAGDDGDVLVTRSSSTRTSRSARAATCSRRASSASRRGAPARASVRSSSAPAPSSGRSRPSTPAASSAPACRPARAPASARTTCSATTSASAPTPCSSSATASATACASTAAASSSW